MELQCRSPFGIILRDHFLADQHQKFSKCAFSAIISNFEGRGRAEKTHFFGQIFLDCFSFKKMSTKFSIFFEKPLPPPKKKINSGRATDSSAYFFGLTFQNIEGLISAFFTSIEKIFAYFLRFLNLPALSFYISFIFFPSFCVYSLFVFNCFGLLDQPFNSPPPPPHAKSNWGGGEKKWIFLFNFENSLSKLSVLLKKIELKH